MYTYEFPRPSVTVDVVLFRWNDLKSCAEVLLIQRGKSPFEGQWAFPGGFLDMHEPPAVAAARELAEETGLTGLPLEQFHTFGEVRRDPRGRVVSIAYFALMPANAVQEATAGDDASDAKWFPLNALPALAFDHQEILETAIERVGQEFRLRPLALRLLSETFSAASLAQLLAQFVSPLPEEEALKNYLQNFLTGENPEQMSFKAGSSAQWLLPKG